MEFSIRESGFPELIVTTAASKTAPELGLALSTPRRHRSTLASVANVLWRRPLALAGVGIVLVWLVVGLFAPLLPIADPDAQNLVQRLKPPGEGHLLGTDDLGRDIFSRIIWGARVSVPAGIAVILVTGFVGCLLGALAGYLGGAVDSVVMRAADVILSFPSIILAMAITAVRGGPGLGNALIAVGFVLWPEYARLMRSQVLTIRENEFVTAARSVGADRNRVLFRHILPSTDAPIIVKATLDVGAAIVLTAGLSFIGLGAVPPTAEWGAMIKQGADKGLQYWWYALVPGVAIMSVVMGLNFFGDGLRDALDPRRRGR
ncbi:MAG: ABC transporter permease [Chloroflexi bacterium]|nr:ABC transporter permease [Chloroflexota bacterium]